PFTPPLAAAPVTATAAPVHAYHHALSLRDALPIVDANPIAPLSDFPLANINIVWGDGVTSHPTSITQPNGVGTPFHIFGSHTYGEEGTVATTPVTVKDLIASASSTTSFPLTAADAP